ncbi:NAD-dependent epimerase/dehydratase family protein [Candidatus Parcubacteria bacterium]|nr:MAG: NAD-dependent epimerase/dehydratase family protein [Candidatus Parcubacteria bacterium]
MNRVLITGGAGFIGSHLCELFVEHGFDVVAFDRYNPNNDWGWLESSPYKNDMEVVLGDIRDYDSVYRAMKGCSDAIHLAALIGIPYSYISPSAYIRTNVEGTYNILEAARNRELDQAIITSTSETYGTAQYTPIDEHHPLVGQSPYAATKIAADQLAISYYLSFDLPVKIARPFNTYGPRQSTRAVIPAIISQALEGNKTIKLGSLSPVRDFTFVKDTCSGFMEIFKSRTLIGEVTNIGMNLEISIGKLAEKIIRMMEFDIELILDKQRVRPDKSEVHRLICNNEKIIAHTGWRPVYDLDRGLSETIDWIRKSRCSYKTLFYTI